MMDRPSSSTNPLFIEQDDDMSSYVTKSHLFGAQRALHQEQQAMSDRIDNLATNLPLSEQQTRDYFNNKLDAYKQENDARMDEIVLCCSTALLTLRPHQDGPAEVDTPTSPSPAQVHRHPTICVVPHAMIVKQASILYVTPTLKRTGNVKPKRLLR